MIRLEKTNKVKNVIIIFLSLLLILSIGFICYDKFLSNRKLVNKTCNCTSCKKCTNNQSIEDSEKVKICNLDMKDKTVLEVYDLCNKKGIDNASKIIVKNIVIDGKSYDLYYDHESYYDSEQGYNNFKASSNSITKLFVNGNLIDVYKGKNRQILWALKINESKLILSETWPSENPPTDYTYDVSDFN